MNSHKKSLMSKEDLLEIFDYINERLKENQLYLELTVYGGSLMTMVYDNRPATKDIDCIINTNNYKLLDEIFKMTKFAFNLQDNWINEEIKEPLHYLIKEDKETYRLYSNLSLLRPIPKQLLAMKILSARPEPSKDFIDANLLCRELEVTSKEKLLKIISEYIPLKLLGEKQINFIKYLGSDLGYDWK